MFDRNCIELLRSQRRRNVTIRVPDSLSPVITVPFVFPYDIIILSTELNFLPFGADPAATGEVAVRTCWSTLSSYIAALYSAAPSDAVENLHTRYVASVEIVAGDAEGVNFLDSIKDYTSYPILLSRSESIYFHWEFVGGAGSTARGYAAMDYVVIP